MWNKGFSRSDGHEYPFGEGSENDLYPGQNVGITEIIYVVSFTITPSTVRTATTLNIASIGTVLTTPASLRDATKYTLLDAVRGRRREVTIEEGGDIRAVPLNLRFSPHDLLIQPASSEGETINAITPDDTELTLAGVFGTLSVNNNTSGLTYTANDNAPPAPRSEIFFLGNNRYPPFVRVGGSSTVDAALTLEVLGVDDEFAYVRAVTSHDEWTELRPAE